MKVRCPQCQEEIKDRYKWDYFLCPMCGLLFYLIRTEPALSMTTATINDHFNRFC